MKSAAYPVTRVGDIAEDEAQAKWLIASLWAASGVGILGGTPKTGKTWLGLDMAISVASGTPCLGHFDVLEPGPVLVFLAEDSIGRARDRVEGICRHRNLDLQALDLFFIDTTALRLDRADDLQRLVATLGEVRPRLLLLDPLVRLHSKDENHAGEISSLLGDLRDLQREYQVAILLVHHARKNARGGNGQALRGSGDLWAWGDSNAYLSRQRGHLVLTLEHRYSAAIDPLTLQLVSRPDGSWAHLEVDSEFAPDRDPSLDLGQRALSALRDASPLTRTALRARLEVNNHRLGKALLQLETDRHIVRGADGWRLRDPEDRSVPAPSDAPERNDLSGSSDPLRLF